MEQRAGTVRYTTNRAGKRAEDTRIQDSAYFYQADVQKRLERDKRAWVALAAGNPLEAHWSDMDRVTPLRLLDRQIAEYEQVAAFAALARHGTFCLYYYPKDILPDAKERFPAGGTRDRRPERVVVLRKHPSKALVDTALPDASRDDTFYDAERQMAREMRGFDSRPQEDKILAQLRQGGLDPAVRVVFAFVVPFFPTTQWMKKLPPPEHVEQFAPYLKYAVASHTRASVLVTLDRWTARYALTGCNYDQMQYKPAPPEYATPEYRLNLYPVSARVRTVRAAGLKLVHLPHACMWERGKNVELERVFRQGVARVQEGMVLSSHETLNPFALMRRAAADRAAAARAASTPQAATPSAPTPVPAPVAMEEDEDEELLAALERAGVARDAPPHTLWLPTYDQNIWKVPARLKQFDPARDACDCPRCTRDGDACPWVAYAGAEREGREGCRWCCCAHGHRNPMGECPAGQGCRGWAIPPLPRDAPRLHQLCRVPLYGRSVTSLGVYATEVGTLLTMAQSAGNTIEHPARHEKYYWNQEHFAENGKEHYVAKWVNHAFPTLVELCVVSIRARVRSGIDDDAALALHRQAMAGLPDAVLDRYFSPCAHTRRGDVSVKWMRLSGCCAACYYRRTDPEHAAAMTKMVEAWENGRE